MTTPEEQVRVDAQASARPAIRTPSTNKPPPLKDFSALQAEIERRRNRKDETGSAVR